MSKVRPRRAVALTAVTLGAGALVLSPIAVGLPSNNPADANTVVSVEGPAGNVLMPMWQSVPKAFGTITVVDSTRQTVKVSQKSVAAQSLEAFHEAGVKVNWTYYPAFHAPYIASIAGIPGKGANGWYFRVNGIAIPKAAGVVNLGVGDRVVWAWGQEKQSALDIVNPSTGIAPGAQVAPGQFAATIQQVTTKGTRSAAAGATVTYGTATGTTDATGTVVFDTQAGVQVLRATKAGMVAATKHVCTQGTSPECPAP
jgi:hypothetical protein